MSDRHKPFAAHLFIFGIALVCLCGCVSTSHPIQEASTISSEALESEDNQEIFAKKSTEELISAGFKYLAMGNTRLARLHFSAAAKRAPDNPVPYLGLGDIDYREGNFPAALASYQKAGSLDENNLAAILGQAQALRQQGNLVEAIKLLERASDLAPDNTNVLTELAIAYDLHGQKTRANQLFREITRKTPNQAAAFNNLGLSQLANQQHAEAVTSLRQALTLSPNDAQISNNLAMALVLSGEENQALTLYKRTVGEAAAWNNIGYLYMTQKRFDDAERALRKAQETNPKYYQKAQENLERLETLRKTATSKDRQHP